MSGADPAAFEASLVGFRLLADSTVRAQFDVEPMYTQAFLQAFHQRGDPAFLVRANDRTQTTANQRSPTHRSNPEKTSGPYSKAAQVLHQSPYFYQVDVWRAVGTDEEYQAWCREQPCSVCAQGGMQSGQPVIYAHVRRASNSGVGIKPAYSGHPCCQEHHRMQHQHGELYVYNSVLSAFKPNTRTTDSDAVAAAKQWYEKMAVGSAYRWCRDTLKRTLGYAHWYDLPPSVLYQWSVQKSVEQHLPREYRDAG